MSGTTDEWNAEQLKRAREEFGNAKMQKRYTVQVQAQIEVCAKSEEDACDAAVAQAMEMESTEWGTMILESGPDCRPAKKVEKHANP